MVRRILAMPVAVVRYSLDAARYSLGAAYVITRVVMLDRMVAGLHS